MSPASCPGGAVIVGGKREASAVERRWLARLVGAAIAVLVVALTLAAAAADADDASPDPGPASGTLIQGGSLSGTVEVDFLVNPDATYTGAITVDGDQLVSESVSQGSAHLYLDTTRLLDGIHSAVVTVSGGDATDTVWSGTIDTLNAPRGGIPAIAGTAEVGATLSATAGSWQPSPSAISYQWELCAAGGSCSAIGGATGSSYLIGSADMNSQVEVEVTASNASGSTSTASLPTDLVLAAGAADGASGAANGSGACSGARLSAAIGKGASETVALGQGATLHGELDCSGAPIADATLDVALARSSGSGPTTHAELQTAADGSFSYSVPAGPSRDITLTYSAYAGQASPSAVATLALLVTPRITLRISPQATTNGHTIVFTGRVLGGYIAAHGLPLEIEYREGSRWMVYTDVLAAPASGRFRWSYTFERTTESITYTFRVAIPATGVAGYPYKPAASPARSVHVDP